MEDGGGGAVWVEAEQEASGVGGTLRCESHTNRGERLRKSVCVRHSLGLGFL